MSIHVYLVKTNSQFEFHQSTVAKNMSTGIENVTINLFPGLTRLT